MEQRQKGEHLAYDKVLFLYQALPYLLLSQLLGALLLSILIYPAVSLDWIVLWLTLNLVVFLYRGYHYFRFRHTPSEQRRARLSVWLNHYDTDMLASALVWGAAAFLIFPASGIIDQVMVLLFLVTIGFTTMGVLASQRELMLVYVGVVFFPVIIRLFLMDEGIYHTLAFAGLALVLIMTLVASYYGTIILHALRAKEEATQTLMQQAQRAESESCFPLFTRAPVAVYEYDADRTIRQANEAFMQLMGCDALEECIGKKIKTIWPDHDALEMHDRVLKGFGAEYKEQLHSRNTKGEPLYLSLSSSPIEKDQQVVGGVTMIQNITEEVHVKDELLRVMHYDTLTNLPNRTLLLQHLKKAVDAKLQTGIFGALLFLDIDRFNAINRTHGQKTGDTLLKRIARKLENLTEGTEIVARIGADTFAILLPVLSADQDQSREKVLDFVAKVRKAFEKVMVLGEADYHVSFTIGAAMFNTRVESPLDILRHAESTMISAKETARGSVRFYEKERDGLALDDMAIANDIYKAIRNNEFTMHYQPQQDIHTGIMTGAEALVRWNHPRRGSISPAHFVPIAEESGAIIRLEEWIFDQVFRDMRKMADTLSEFPLNYIAVNVSSIHFLQPNFVEKFVDMVHKHRINPQWVNIEITESGIMSSIEGAIERIKTLRRLGFGFSIDDFGTGYSSLTYLKKLPVDIIKIDRSFVKDADRNEEDRLIVESVIEISRRFGFKVLVEGIDRQETLDYFRNTSCKTFQGYLFYKPLSLKEFIQLI